MFMNCRACLFLLLTTFPFLVKAQTPGSMDAAQIKQGLESLNVTGSVLYIAAHPDDENTRLLAYLAKGKKVRAGYLSLTRGDGGQNLIGTEQADLLGVVRTQELLAARRVDGAEQFFTRANDFGFSKTSEECLKIWGHQKILGDVVWVIRNFKPDVMVTRFPEDARAGHGAHAASAILAREAFAAAADPKQFPEQLKFVKPWQAKRIVWNTFNFGGNNTTSDEQLKLDVGIFNPLIGESYGEIAAESRSNHKSQGFGSAKQRGPSIEFFSPIAGTAAVKDLFEGIDFSLNRSAATATVQKLVKEINEEFQVSNPSKSITKLLRLKAATKGIDFKKELLDQLILSCAGIWLETSVPSSTYALNDSIPVSIQAISRLKADAPYKVVLEVPDARKRLDLLPEQLASYSISVPARALGSTQPYWLRKKHPIGSYDLESLDDLGRPQNLPPSLGKLRISINDTVIDLNQPLIYKFTDPARGEIYQPLVVGPPITATINEGAYVFNNNEQKVITVSLKSLKANASGVLTATVPEGWQVSPQQVAVKFDEKSEEKTTEFKVTPGGVVSRGTFSLSIKVDGIDYNKGYHQISYAHIPVQTLFPFAEARVEKVDLKFAGKRIGYIAGAGDLVPESLREIGYEVTMLNTNLVLHSDLSRFDAIITGVRLYNINEQVAAMQPRLMEYVKSGGTLLVQYNVNSPLKTNNLGPYPFKLSRDRVTEENAVVSFLHPENSILNFPNKISAKDFEGWVQERAIYSANELDPRYTPLLSMNDVSEQPQTGSLLVADYGRGKYIYTGLVFYRELPAGVPGAYRLIVNLISSGQSK
ncbi:MAG: LmbE family protein [Pedobacter sp.]|nr:LmbE family protein [Pedobacter sp.]